MDSGLLPLLDKKTYTLIVGSAPGSISLKKKQYYGGPGNSFWPIMTDFFHFSIGLSYKDRSDLLQKNGIGLTDAYLEFDRIGSLDSQFKKTIKNPFTDILTSHPIQLILANGKKAGQEVLNNTHFDDSIVLICPSTSGANNAQMNIRKIQWNLALHMHKQLLFFIENNYTVLLGNSSELREKVRKLRKEVFVKEQTILVENEFDSRDYLPNILYFLVLDKEKSPIATIRYQTLSEGTIQPDRFCVAKKFRNQKIGQSLLRIYELYAQFNGFRHSELSA